MPTISYKTNYFDFSSTDAIGRFLGRVGIPAKAEYKFSGIDVTVPLGTPSQAIDDAVDAATMHYCDECTARLQRINKTSKDVCAQCALAGRSYCPHAAAERKP